jgi:hypothetical protein
MAQFLPVAANEEFVSAAGTVRMAQDLICGLNSSLKDF